MRSHRSDQAEPEVDELESGPARYPGKVTLTAGFRARAGRDALEHVAQDEPRTGKAVPRGAGSLAALDDPFGLHVPIQAKGDLRGARCTVEAGALPAASSGAPLPPAVRAMMERAFNADFGDVRIHVDSARAAALGARAYTEGNSVHVAPGEYDPESSAGRELIGHELAHVVQQRQGRVAATSQVRGIAINDAPGLEQEADVLGQRAASGAGAGPAPAGPAPSIEAPPVATPAPATHAVAQRQAAPQSNQETLDGEVEAAAQLELSRVPAERAYGTRLVLLLTQMRPENIDDDAVLFPFIDKCQELARDERLTLEFLAFRKDRNAILEEDGGGFPAAWAERMNKELHVEADLKELEAAYRAERASALASVDPIDATVWARGLPLTLDQARHLDADGLVRDVLTYRRLAAGSSEPTDRYAAAMASWLRVAAHYGALLEHERDLADQVRQIRDGEVEVTRSYYKQQRAKFAELQAALQFVQHAGADPARVARTFFRVLSWTVGESLAQYGGNGVTTWPLDGVAAYRAELAKVDARLAGAGAPDAITRALTWAHERGYLSAAGREVWNAIQADAVKMIATAVGILIVQQIPGVNVALDVVLVIEFGLDAVATLGEVVDALNAAIHAKSVVAMEHAAATMAATIAGDAAKLLLWAATWGLAKAAKRIKSYREGKAFLDEHGHSPEAREALAAAKGDVAKAKAALAKKRAQEQRARDQADLDQPSASATPRQNDAPAHDTSVAPQGSGKRGNDNAEPRVANGSQPQEGGRPAPSWDDIVAMETAANPGEQLRLANEIVANPGATYHHYVFQRGCRAIVSDSRFRAGDGTASFGGPRSVRAYIGPVNPVAAKITHDPIIEFQTTDGAIPATRMFSGRPGAYWVSDGYLQVRIVKVYLPGGRIAVPTGRGTIMITESNGASYEAPLTELPE